MPLRTDLHQKKSVAQTVTSMPQSYQSNPYQKNIGLNRGRGIAGGREIDSKTEEPTLEGASGVSDLAAVNGGDAPCAGPTINPGVKDGAGEGNRTLVLSLGSSLKPAETLTESAFQAKTFRVWCLVWFFCLRLCTVCAMMQLADTKRQKGQRGIWA
jgi:hypothetical protein